MTGARAERDAAYHTLLRGTRFMAALAGHPRSAMPWPADQADAHRARYLANCLRELDRFLHVLMDQTAPPSAIALPAERNAANRIDRLLPGPAGPERDRLLALGRTRACLWHCGGRVRRPDDRGGVWMRAGWQRSGTAGLQRYRLGERLAPAGAELADVGAFYRGLGDRLVDAG